MRELLRNGNHANAFQVPASTFALDLQRCRKASHTPTAAQQIHIYKPADALRTRQIAKAAI